MKYYITAILALIVIGISFSFFSMRNTREQDNEHHHDSNIMVILGTAPCSAGEMQKDCLKVENKASKQGWDYFYNDIEGFTYETGHTYTLEVKKEEIKNPPADGSTVRYTLVKVLEKK